MSRVAGTEAGSGMDDLTAEIVGYLASLRFEDLPPGVIAAAKRNLLDTLLVARAGAQADGVGAMLSLVRTEAKVGACTVWGHACKLPPAPAAQINAIAAAALDFDSLCLTVHADCVVVPAAIAAGEEMRASGEDLLVAYCAGVEIMARLSRASVPPQVGWTHTAVFGVFGAAIATALLFDLSPKQISHAIGICLSLAAGSQQSNLEQTLTKRLQPALAARNGVFAAQAARAGIEGPGSSIQGKAGLWALYQAGSRDRFVRGLGREYVMLLTGLKKYPVCACSHTVIEACLKLTKGEPLRAEEIVAIEVTLTPFMAYMVAGDFNPVQKNPVVAAQFSVRYAIAAALLRGHIDLSDLSINAISEPRVLQIAQKIVVHVDQNASGEVEPATVRLMLEGRGGDALTVGIMPGSVAAPLSAEEFDAKLTGCHRAAPLPDTGLAALRQLVSDLEQVEDIAAIGALLGRVPLRSSIGSLRGSILEGET